MNESTATIRVQSGVAALNEHREAWEALWSASAEATDAQIWGWVRAYVEHVAVRSRLAVVSAVSNGETVALGAFAIARDRRTMLRTAGFLGESDADAHVMLARPDLPESTGAAMLAALAESPAGRAAILEFRNVPKDTWTHRAVEQYLGGVTATIERRESPSYAVPLPATYAEYEQHFRARTGRSFQEFQRKRRNLLKDYRVEFRMCRDDEQIDAAFEEIERIDFARWREKSRYQAARDRAFHRAAARDLCRRGVYRAYRLIADGTPVAYIAGIRVRDCFRVPTLAHDPSFPGRYSAGKVLNLHVIEQCIEEGCRTYDLTRGDEEYKVWLGGELRPNCSARIYRSRLARPAQRAAAWMRAALRKRGAA